MSTIKAAFGRRVPLVDFDKGPSIPLRFVLKLSHQFRPSHITDGLSQTMVLDYILDVQTLDAYDLVLTYDLCRELVLRVSSSVSNASVNTSHFHAGFRTVLRAFFLACMSPLRFCQFFLLFDKELGVAVGMPIGSNHHRLQAQIKPDLLIDKRRVLDILFNQERDKVAVRTILAHSHRRRLGSFGQGTRPMDIQRGFHLGKGKGLSIPFECRGGILSRLLVVLFVELGICCMPFKEVFEGFIEMSQGLLKGNTRDFIQPRTIFLLFQQRQLCRGFMIANTHLLFVVGIGTQAQRPIIHVTSTAKCTSKMSRLLISWIDAILICSFLFHVSHASIYRVKYQQARVAPIHLPRIRNASFLPVFENWGIQRREV